MRRFIAGVLFLALFVSFANAETGKPIDELKKRVVQIVNIMENPDYEAADKKDVQIEELWKVVLDTFDFSVIAKRALGKNRKTFTKDQLNRFTDVFANLLGNTYLDSLQSEYRQVDINYLSEALLSERKALVKTTVTIENIETPIDYSLLKTSKGWKIYDVKVEGVSLVKNYRGQINKILMKNSPDHLIEKLKEKIEKQKEDKKRGKKPRKVLNS